MKKVENLFTVTGFVGKDAEIRQFTTSSVARFSLAIGRTEKNGDKTTRVSAFMTMEAWRKNESASFELLKKGAMITVKGYFKPEEWTDQAGVKHNRIAMVATEFFATPEKETELSKKKGSSKKSKK